MYCGEWIESHALHVFLLHAPDFLGFESAWQMARDHRDVVEGALRVKAMGNEILRTIGGRAIHPINIRVGGFYKAPEQLGPRGVGARPGGGAGVGAQVGGLASQVSISRTSSRTTSSSPCAIPDRYAIEDGRLVSSSGLDIGPASTRSTSPSSRSRTRRRCSRG